MTPYRPDLSKVSILIKTFLRDNHLEEAIAGIMVTMPEVRMIIVDDGDRSARKKAIYDDLYQHGHAIIEMPFDSGFGAKSNAAIDTVKDYILERPYLLIGSDDFDFRPATVRQGIERLVAVLDGDPEIAIASGRVNGNRYEGWLRDHGDRIVEEYITFDQPRHVNGVTHHLCNLTVNYSLIRGSILGSDKIHWDDDVKIGGGEHGAFFVDVMRAGHKVAYVPQVDIKEQVQKPTDRRYQTFRGRASRPGRPCFQRRGIREYVMFGGGVERA
jgi:glycosyltransferase involved in cell wall biosynthesis